MRTLGFVLAGLLSASFAWAEPPQGWQAAGGFAAPEAKQAVAADERFVYVVTNDQVAKYDREGKFLARSTGKAKHLNSAFIHEGHVYCAHSNYPTRPEESEIRRLDPTTMELSVHKSFGNFGGSLTWAVREGDRWWCCFAQYGPDNRKTFLVEFDPQWRELRRFQFPAAAYERIGAMSFSGGIWLDGALLVSDHDHGRLYELRLPKEGNAKNGNVLELVGEQPAPITGQGFAFDSATKGLIGIDRAKRRVVFMSTAAGGAQSSTPAGVEATIDRGIAFLAKDALAWKEKHNCASCHHAALVVWAFHEAKRQSYAVDEPVLTDMTKWLTEAGSGKVSLPRPKEAPNAFSSKALYFALALGFDPKPSEAVKKSLPLLLGTVIGDQQADGSWQAWPETRPPMFGGTDERITVLETLALLPAAAAGDKGAIAARDKAVERLSTLNSDDDLQTLAMRLVLWTRLNRPAAEWKPLIVRIRERQNADGGWSQTKEMPSDAWATGQALYALAHARLTPDDPAIERGRAFLMKTQRDDGSWPMTSQPSKPGDEGAKYLVPITGAGSAWGVMGLVRSRPPRDVR